VSIDLVCGIVFLLGICAIVGNVGIFKQ